MLKDVDEFMVSQVMSKDVLIYLFMKDLEEQYSKGGISQMGT